MFFQEKEYRQIMFLPDIVTLQNRLVKKYQNASEQIVGSISDFLENQKGNFIYHTANFFDDTQFYGVIYWAAIFKS